MYLQTHVSDMYKCCDLSMCKFHLVGEEEGGGYGLSRLFHSF